MESKTACYCCKETFQNQIQLSCKHFLCPKCLMRQILKKNLLDLPDKETLTFTCKCKIGFIDLSLYKIEDLITKNSEKTIPQCKNHQLDAIKYCRDCKNFLCQKCFDAHKELFPIHNVTNVTDSKNKLITVNNIGSICPIHGREYINYCKSDKVSLCNSCINDIDIANAHKDHEVITYKSMLNNVNEKSNKLQFKTYKSCSDYIDKVENDIDNKYNDNYNKTTKILESMIETLNKIQEDYQKKMEIKFSKKNLVMSILKRVYQNYYDDLKDVKGGKKDIRLIKFLSRDYSEFSDIRFKSDLDPILNKLEKIKSNFEKEDISTMIKVSYSYFAKKELKLYNSLKDQFKDIITDIIELKDGRIVISSEDNIIKIFDKSGNCIYILKGHLNGVRCLCSIKEAKFASGSADKTVRVWDLKLNKTVEILKEQSNPIINLSILQGEKLASCSFREIYIYDDKYKPQYILKEHSNWVRNIIPLDKNKSISCSDDGIIKIYDKYFRVLNTLKDHNNIPILCLCLLRDGRLISGDKKGKALIWDKNLHDNKEIKFHKNSINKIIQLKDGRIVSCSSDKTIKVWDIDLRNLYVFKNHTNSVNALCAFRDGGMCSGGSDIVVYLWK